MVNKNNKPDSLQYIFDAIKNTGLLNKVLITLGLLAIYRLGIQVPLPYINHEVFQAHSNMLSTGILGMVDMFAGGALSALSVFALGIGPFITASIMMQLIAEVFPSIKTLQKEMGEQGRRQVQQYTRRLTLLLAILQSFALAKFITFQAGSIQASTGESLLFFPGSDWLYIVEIVILMSAGALFIMWLGELISAHGIGNGGSLLIFAGIASGMPSMIIKTYNSYVLGSIPTWGLITLILFFVLVLCAIICLQEGVRKLLIIGSKQNFGREISTNASQANFLPLKVNPAGVLPIIFGSMAMFVPFQILNFLDQHSQASLSSRIHDIVAKSPLSGLTTYIDSQANLTSIFAGIGEFFDKLFSYYTIEHSILYFVLILIFAYFYASILLPARDIASNLQKGGTALYGVKPGKPTGDYLEALVNRLVLVGGVSIALITIAPIHMEKFTQVTTLGGLGSTSLIIMVGVAIDLYTQIMSYLQAHQYKVKSLLD